MSEFNITVEGGSSVRLPTAGKYCDRDIVITATSGGSGEISTGTCTIEITVPAAANYYFAYEKISGGKIVYQTDRNYLSANATSTKVVRCDSVMYIQASNIKGVALSDGELVRLISGYGIVYNAPSTEGVTATITLSS